VPVGRGATIHDCRVAVFLSSFVFPNVYFPHHNRLTDLCRHNGVCLEAKRDFLATVGGPMDTIQVWGLPLLY